MQKLYQRFVDILSAHPNQRELETALAGVAGALGLPMFAYLLRPEQGSAPSLISNYPGAWTEHYLAHRYDRLDPVIGTATRTAEPFEWGPDLRASQRSECSIKFFAEAAQFGIRFGFTIPIRDRQRGLAAVTFATDERRTVFRQSVDAYRSGLYLMAHFFHRQACSALDPDRRIDGIKLSPRQFECLEWVARGKSTWDTGRIIGISRRTVLFHLEAAKAKLDVKSMQHAIAKYLAEKSKN
jgi:DNA-binding CsgD family transcriptional regulator